MLHASAAFLEVLLELLEDRGGANHIIQSWDTSTCVIEVFFEVYVEIREIDPLSVIVPISKIRKPHLPIGLNISNTLYRADVPSKKWFRIVFREDQPSTKEQPEGAREPE